MEVDYQVRFDDRPPAVFKLPNNVSIDNYLYRYPPNTADDNSFDFLTEVTEDRSSSTPADDSYEEIQVRFIKNPDRNRLRKEAVLKGWRYASSSQCFLLFAKLIHHA